MASDNAHSNWSDVGSKVWNTAQEALQNKYVDAVLCAGAVVAVLAFGHMPPEGMLLQPWTRFDWCPYNEF